MVGWGAVSSESPNPTLETWRAPVPVATREPYQPVAQVARDRAAPTPHRDRLLLQTDEAARFADMLTSDGSSASLSATRASADLGAQIAAVRDSGRVLRIGSGSPDIGGGPGRGSSVPSGRVSTASKAAVDDTSLTPDMMHAKIQAVYMAGIKRCYAQLLTKDPTLRGMLSIAFKVDANGRATGGMATTL